MGIAASPIARTVRRHWLPAFFGGCAVALLPWSIVINAALPSRTIVSHWDIAWTGFDLALGTILLSTAVAARRGSASVRQFATAGATLLVCDAWFDILTSGSRNELTAASIEAAVAELPLALLCFAIARNPQRFMRDRAAKQLRAG